MRDATKVSDIVTGLKVEIESKGELQTGIITEILTTRDNPRGIRVRIDNGASGRIKQIIDENLITTVKVVKDNVVSDIKKNTIINISDDEILPFIKAGGQLLIKEYSVTTKFFKAIYCKKVHEELNGIVIFKVKGENINIAVYKINKFLKKFCVTKDIKYEVIKVED